MYAILAATFASSCTKINLSHYEADYYDPTETNLRLDGFYSIPCHVDTENDMCIDRPIFLYRDGSALALLNYGYSDPLSLASLHHDKLESFVYPFSGWGRYFTSNDTLYIQYVAHVNAPSLIRRIDTIKLKALINSDTSFTITHIDIPDSRVRLLDLGEIHVFSKSTKPDSVNWVKKRVHEK